ncbi:MAG: LUD domain-containing protein [Chitinophagaceae bacterium]
MASISTSPAREKILGKLRTGLQKGILPMPFPEAENTTIPELFEKTSESLEECFANEFIRLGGKFIFCANEMELLQRIQILHDGEEWQQLLCSEPYLLDFFQKGKLDFITAADPNNESAEACITGCEALVARTGSFIFSSKQPMGRVAPVYYPIHIVVAFARQLVPDISDGLSLMQTRYEGALPSMINLNTGPSRTADIEKTLVVGVHGPKEVYCLFVNN